MFVNHAMFLQRTHIVEPTQAQWMLLLILVLWWLFSCAEPQAYALAAAAAAAAAAGFQRVTQARRPWKQCWARLW
jgi:hypothetical protein